MASKYELLDLNKQLCFPLYLCSKELIRKYTLLLNEIDLTYTQYIVMLYFWEKQKSNVKEIGKVLLLDSSTLTPLLKKLENKGFITRVRSTVDERNLEIEITKKGWELRDKAVNIPEKIKNIIKLPEKDEAKLFELIYEVLRNTQKEED